MLERGCRWTTGEGEDRNGIVRLAGRFDVEGFKKDNSWNEDGIRKMEPLSYPAEPRAECGRVSCRLVVDMLPLMGHGRR